MTTPIDAMAELLCGRAREFGVLITPDTDESRKLAFAKLMDEGYAEAVTHEGGVTYYATTD